MTGSYPPTAPYPSLAERAARYSFYPIYYTHAWSGAFRCILYLHSVVLSSQATQCKVDPARCMQQMYPDKITVPPSLPVLFLSPEDLFFSFFWPPSPPTPQLLNLQTPPLFPFFPGPSPLYNSSSPLFPWLPSLPAINQVIIIIKWALHNFEKPGSNLCLFFTPLIPSLPTLA